MQTIAAESNHEQATREAADTVSVFLPEQDQDHEEQGAEGESEEAIRDYLPPEREFKVVRVPIKS